MSKRAVVHLVDADADPIERIAGQLKSQGVDIVDQQPNMLLVDGNRDAIDRALGMTHGWTVSEERTIPRPRTRPRVLRRPG